MKYYEKTVVVQAEPSTIWAVFADVKNWTDWDGGLYSVPDVGTGLVENGESVFSFSGGMRATTTFTNIVENQGFNWSSKSMVLNIDARFDIRSVENGQEVTYRFGIGGILGTILNLFMKKTVDFDTLRDLNSIKSIAEEKQAQDS
jgi:hypothetical protein